MFVSSFMVALSSKAFLKSRDISGFCGDVFATERHTNGMLRRRRIPSILSEHIVIMSSLVCEFPFETKGRVVP